MKDRRKRRKPESPVERGRRMMRASIGVRHEQDPALAFIHHSILDAPNIRRIHETLHSHAKAGRITEHDANAITLEVVDKIAASMEQFGFDGMVRSSLEKIASLEKIKSGEGTDQARKDLAEGVSRLTEGTLLRHATSDKKGDCRVRIAVRPENIEVWLEEKTKEK